MDFTKPLVTQITDKLLNYIIKNELKAGDKLPNEYELAELLGVGRSTIRESVKMLVIKNVLEVRQGSGTFVAEHRLGVAKDPLGFTFISDKKKLTHDLLEMRIIIEPRIASLSAMNRTDEEVIIMEDLCIEIENLIYNDKDHTEKDILLHTKIAESSKNTIAPNLMPIIQSAISIFIDTTNSKLRQETIETHKEIVKAIKEKNPIAASDAMLLHLIYNRNLLHQIDNI